MTSKKKQTTALALTGAIALASGAYALGSQVDGAAVAAGDRPGAMGHHMRGGPGPGLDRLADRLGVDQAELRAALEDVRGDLGKPDGMRDDFAKELADELGTTQAKVEAAIKRIREKHAKELEGRRDALAEALAKRLNLDASKVEEALETPGFMFRGGRRGGP
jgi:hypothetical protein